MNAAFLLVTTAWLAGADGQPPANPAPATIIQTGGGSCGSCNTCSTCNDCCGNSWGGRMRGWFHRDCNECSSCGGREHHKSCGCERQHKACNTCNECDNGCGHGWGGRMRGWFHRDCNDCNSCNTCGGCSNCAGGTVTPAPAAAPGAEPLKKAPTPAEPPKQMPKTTQIPLNPPPVARTGGLIVE